MLHHLGRGWVARLGRDLLRPSVRSPYVRVLGFYDAGSESRAYNSRNPPVYSMKPSDNAHSNFRTGNSQFTRTGKTFLDCVLNTDPPSQKVRGILVLNRVFLQKHIAESYCQIRTKSLGGIAPRTGRGVVPVKTALHDPLLIQPFSLKLVKISRTTSESAECNRTRRSRIVLLICIRSLEMKKVLILNLDISPKFLKFTARCGEISLEDIRTRP